MARERRERVHGPYQHGQRWRVVVVGADGSRATASCETRAEADAIAREARGQADARSLAVAVEAFLAERARIGTLPQSIRTARAHLEALLQLERNGNRQTRWLASKGAELYAAAQVRTVRGEPVPVAPDTHRNRLSMGKSFGAFCVEQGWLAANPFGKVKGVGKRSPGKPQLRIDESRRLLDLGARRAASGDEGALAALLCLLLGVRASELSNRVVRDVDDGGRLLVVPAAKTRSGRRSLEVPAVVQAPLMALTVGRAPAEPLFRLTRFKARPPADRYWVLREVRRLCAAAGVPVVSAHGLRGTHSSLATEAGTTAHVVAASLGHAGPGITQRAYIDASATEGARGRRAQARLAGEVTNPSDGDG